MNELPKIRSWNEGKQIVLLDPDYLFAYHYLEYSSRSLSAEVTVDFQGRYVFVVELWGEDQVIHKEITELPDQLYLYLDELEKLGFDFLEKNYFYHAGINVGSQQILINNDDLEYTQNIYIQNGTTIEYFKHPAEKLLFELNEFLKNRIEQLYKAWLISQKELNRS